MHGEMMGGPQMGGMGYRDMLLKRAWEYLDEDQTRQMILRMLDKKILYIGAKMEMGKQKLETMKMMREMIAKGGTGGK
ncbi:MAG TPA: hypothetical protein HA263_06975 [Methanoregulaceae archaeon]|nr:hypothetical protein [Methanoregulaceae archaeon]